MSTSEDKLLYHNPNFRRRQTPVQVDKCEQQQHEDLRVSSKKMRQEQEKELKGFRDSLKQEMKLLKHEVELLPKDRRKEALRLVDLPRPDWS